MGCGLCLCDHLQAAAWSAAHAGAGSKPFLMRDASIPGADFIILPEPFSAFSEDFPQHSLIGTNSNSDLKVSNFVQFSLCALLCGLEPFNFVCSEMPMK